MTRLYIRLLSVGLLGLLLFLSACDLTSLNENPNAPRDARPDYLFTNAVKDIAETNWGGFTLGRFSNLYAQYWTQNQYTAEDRYAFPQNRSGVVNSMWEGYYLALNDLEEVIRLNRETPEATEPFGNPDNQIAMSMIMQAWTFHVMTDIWGPIPFEETLQGAQNANPAYASQEDVYLGVLDMLEEAIGMINQGQVGLINGDPVYGGDMEMWQKFAHSLKLRVAMRMSDVGSVQDLVSSTIQNSADEAFESYTENALVAFDASPPYQNPIYENYEIEGRDDWAVTESLLGLMQENDDPRIPIYAEPSGDGSYIGYPYGLTEGAAQDLYSQGELSRPGMAVREPDAPAILMTHSEVQFILAEAVERGYISGSAEDYFQQGMISSLRYWGVEDENEIDDFVSSISYDSGNWQQSIGEQKWVALYMQGIQGWSEWRRLDFEGVVTPPVAGAIPDFGRDIAVRLSYPNDEANLNSANLQAAIDNHLGGPDHQGTQLWWDVN